MVAQGGLDLHDLGKYRENNRIEAKKAAGGLPRSLWETYSAFANTIGGILLLGVEEKSDKSLNAIGLANAEKMLEEFRSILNNPTKVNINILSDNNVRIVDIDGKKIIYIEVPRADRSVKPVFIGENPFSGTYRRSGEGDYHCTKEEVANMFRDQGNVSQDLKVLATMGLDVFDYDSLKRYRMRMSHIRPGHIWQELPDDQFLYKIGAVGRSEDGNSMHPTAAGLLMFGFEYEIVKEFPNYFLDYQEQYSVDTRWTDRIVSSSGDWSGNIYDFFFRVYNKISLDIKVPFKLENGRDRIDDTPVHKALREALANALIHANYYGRQGLVIIQKKDSIIISNPGALRISVQEAISGGTSDPRNSTLIKMFNLINIGEGAGSGIPNIHAVWHSLNWPSPVLAEKFDPDRTALSLVIPVSDEGGDNVKVAINNGDKPDALLRTDDQKQRIIEYLTQNVRGKNSDFATLLGVKSSRVKQLLSELSAEDIVIPEGANKNRTYRLKA